MTAVSSNSNDVSHQTGRPHFISTWFNVSSVHCGIQFSDCDGYSRPLHWFHSKLLIPFELACAKDPQASNHRLFSCLWLKAKDNCGWSSSKLIFFRTEIFHKIGLALGNQPVDALKSHDLVWWPWKAHVRWALGNSFRRVTLNLPPSASCKSGGLIPSCWQIATR